MGKKLIYTSVPSLEHIALIKIAVTLWNQDEIRALNKSRFKEKNTFKKSEKKVMKKISQLTLPGFLKEKLLVFIQPIGLQILKWIENAVVDQPNQLRWTQQGTIDKKRTVQVIIKDDSLTIIKRYKLACIYCLEDDIKKLWNIIPANCKKSFYSEASLNELVIFWTLGLMGEADKLDSMIDSRWQRRRFSYQEAYDSAAGDCNKVATEYFLQKLTPSEREESLVKSTRRIASICRISGHTMDHEEDYIDFFCFLISQMNEEQQKNAFKRYPNQVLVCLLYWPWQSFFMEIANLMWDFLHVYHYYCLLQIIINKIKNGYKDFQYLNLFREYWQQSPIKYKEFVFDKCSANDPFNWYVLDEFASGQLLKKLLCMGEIETVKFLLENASIPIREKLIFSDNGIVSCKILIFNDKTDVLKVFVHECIASKDVMVKFKKEFKKTLSENAVKDIREKQMNMFNMLCQVLDELFQEDDKSKGLEEGNRSSAAEGIRSVQVSSSKDN